MHLTPSSVLWTVGLSVLGLVFASSLACATHPDEAAAVVRSLEMTMRNLQAEVTALRVENARLRGQLLAGPTWSERIQLQRAGGTMRSIPYVRSCLAGQSLIGVRGNSGEIMDSMRPVCALLSGPGHAEGGAVESELDAVGGESGHSYERLCPPGRVVVGIRGGEEQFVNSMRLVCATRPSPPHPAADGTPAASGDAHHNHGAELDRVGGAGGRAYERLCPGGWVGVGMSGSYGRFVESISLHCARVH